MFIQLLLLTAVVVGMLLTLRRAMQGVIRRIETIGWTVIWVLAIIVILRPETTTAIARLVGVGRGSDLTVYISVIVLFFLVFHLHVLHDRLERTLTELIRRDALRGVSDMKHHFETISAPPSSEKK